MVYGWVEISSCFLSAEMVERTSAISTFLAVSSDRAQGQTAPIRIYVSGTDQ